MPSGADPHTASEGFYQTMTEKRGILERAISENSMEGDLRPDQCSVSPVVAIDNDTL
jgi:hypothetical protein